VLAVGAILLATLHPDETARGTARLVPQWRFDFLLGDALRNVILFLPLGVALAARPTAAGRALAAAAALSAAVELAQMVIPGRAGSPVDVGTNALGAGLGFAAVRTAPAWLRPAAARRRRLVAAAGLGVAASVVGASALFAPTWEGSVHTAGLGAEADTAGPVPVQVRAGRIGDLALSPDEQVAGPRLQAALAGDWRLRLDGVAGGVGGRSTLFAIRDERGRQVLELAAQEGDLLHEWRIRGRELGLEPARVWLAGAFARANPGEPVALHAAHRGADVCLGLGEERRCGLGFTAGDAWLLIAPSSPSLGLLRGSAGAAWVALSCVPLGLWTRRDAASALGWGAATAALLAAPALGALVATPADQLAGAAAGGLLGAALARTAGADRHRNP